MGGTVVLLVRFGELALKSRYVRRQLRDRLVGNIQELFASEGVECITEADEARIYVHVNEVEKGLAILGRAFGVVSLSPATEVHADLDTLRKAVRSEASRSLSAGQSFALRPRRVGTHPFTSQDLARELGDDIRRDHPDVRVDLGHPDVEIHVEVRHTRAFVFQEIRAGPGGLPLGSQGRALAVVRNEADMVAAWMGMKRGCRVVVAAADGKAFVEPLRAWDVRLKVLDLPAQGDLGELVRIARAEAIFLGTRWSEFDPTKRPDVAVPIFEPVIGLADVDVNKIASRIRAAGSHLPIRS